MTDETKRRIEEIEHKIAMCDEVAYVDYQYSPESTTTYNSANEDMKWLIQMIKNQ